MVNEERKHYFSSLWGVTVHLLCPFAIHLQLSLCASPTSRAPIFLLITALFSELLCYSPPLPSYVLTLHIPFSFLFLDHLPQILVPTFVLSFAFSFPFTTVNRRSILLLPKAIPWFLFLAWPSLL